MKMNDEIKIMQQENCDHRFIIPVETESYVDGNYNDVTKVLRLACTKCALTRRVAKTTGDGLSYYD